MDCIRKILLIENSSLDFYKARIPLALYLKSKGWDVYALVPLSNEVSRIKSLGINVITFDFERKNKGLKQLIKLYSTYYFTFKKYDFNVIHSFRFYPNLLNTLVNVFNKRKVITHITGLGIAFSNNSLYFRIVKQFSLILYQLIIFRSNKIIVQNDNDKKDLLFLGFGKNKIQVIYGSGVNTDIYNPQLYNKQILRSKLNIYQKNKVFICVTRLIWEKGIKELIDSFIAFNKMNPNTILLLVGWIDEDNPRHVPLDFINNFNNHYNIKFLGKQDNIKELLALSDVFVYPSYYREGIPRSILEALSMGLPIITTNMPGCKLTVDQGENGIIVEPRSSSELYESFLNINNFEFEEMSKRSRNKALNNFSEKIIFKKIERIYIE
jgi:glycosyltransferase involved in cell wall biosynthesis